MIESIRIRSTRRNDANLVSEAVVALNYGFQLIKLNSSLSFLFGCPVFGFVKAYRGRLDTFLQALALTVHAIDILDTEALVVDPPLQLVLLIFGFLQFLLASLDFLLEKLSAVLVFVDFRVHGRVVVLELNTVLLENLDLLVQS